MSGKNKRGRRKQSDAPAPDTLWNDAWILICQLDAYHDLRRKGAVPSDSLLALVRGFDKLVQEYGVATYEKAQTAQFLYGHLAKPLLALHQKLKRRTLSAGECLLRVKELLVQNEVLLHRHLQYDKDRSKYFTHGALTEDGAKQLASSLLMDEKTLSDQRDVPSAVRMKLNHLLGVGIDLRTINKFLSSRSDIENGFSDPDDLAALETFLKYSSFGSYSPGTVVKTMRLIRRLLEA